MYISKSSELRCISPIDIPLLEAGLINSLGVCLEFSETIKISRSEEKARLNCSMKPLITW